MRNLLPRRCDQGLEQSDHDEMKNKHGDMCASVACGAELRRLKSRPTRRVCGNLT